MSRRAPLAVAAALRDGPLGAPALFAENAPAATPLTIKAEGASCTLPPIGIADCSQRFGKIC